MLPVETLRAHVYRGDFSKYILNGWKQKNKLYTLSGAWMLLCSPGAGYKSLLLLFLFLPSNVAFEMHFLLCIFCVHSSWTQEVHSLYLGHDTQKNG